MSPVLHPGVRMRKAGDPGHLLTRRQMETCLRVRTVLTNRFLLQLNLGMLNHLPLLIPLHNQVIQLLLPLIYLCMLVSISKLSGKCYTKLGQKR